MATMKMKMVIFGWSLMTDSTDVSLSFRYCVEQDVSINPIYRIKQTNPSHALDHVLGVLGACLATHNTLEGCENRLRCKARLLPGRLSVEVEEFL